MPVMRVLVTGVGGFIGANLAEHLAQTGHDVAGIGRPSHLDWLLDELGIEHAIADVRDPLQLHGIREVDAIVHLAAQTDVGRSWFHPAADASDNVVGTITVALEACRRGVPIVVAGSCAAYGPGGPHWEGDLALALAGSPYAASKRATVDYTRLLCQAAHIPWTALIFANVYGPLQRTRALVPELIAHYLAGSPFALAGDGSQTRDFVYVSDVVAAIMASLATHPGWPEEICGGVINVGTGIETSARTVAELVRHAVGSDAPLPPPSNRPTGFARSVLNVDRALAMLDWHALVDVEEGIHRTVAAAR